MSAIYKVYIGMLPKDELLYSLWLNAKISPSMKNLPKLQLTIDQVQSDIRCMIVNNRNIDLMVYYSRMIYLDISKDYVNNIEYDARNGIGLLAKVTNKLKKKELKKCLLNFYKFQ